MAEVHEAAGDGPDPSATPPQDDPVKPHVTVAGSVYTSLTDIAYANRRLVVFGDPPSVPPLELPPAQLALNIARLGRGHPAIAVGAAAAGAAAYGGAWAWQRFDVARKRKAAVLYVPRDMAEPIDFPLESDPREGVVYAAHPTVPTVYFAVSDVNVYLLKERILEHVQLLRDLGAEEIEIEADDAASAATLDLSLKLPITVNLNGLPIPLGNTDSALSASWEEKRTASYFWNGPPSPVAEFDEAKYLWLAEDPLLQDLVSTRLAGLVYETRITISSSKKYGISASTAAQLVKASHRVGGDIKYTESTRMSIRVQFPRISEERP